METAIQFNDLYQLAIVKNKTYNYHISRFNQFLQETGQALTLDAIGAYWQTLKNNGTPAASINAIGSALKAGILATYKKAGDSLTARFILDSKFKDVWKSCKISRQVDDLNLLTDSDIYKLLKGASQRHRLIIYTLYKTGLRVSELLSLKKSRARLQNGHYSFKVIGKRNKERTVFLSVKLVDNICSVYGGKDYLFISERTGRPLTRQAVHLAIKKLGRDILKRDTWPHQFRHTFATKKIITENKSLKAVSNYLGHSKASTTVEMYCHDKLTAQDVL